MGKSDGARTRSLYLTDKLMEEIEEELKELPRDWSKSKLAEKLLWMGLKQYRKEKE